ncbi:hypothetical protein HQ489_02775, partial [Candidatus Woesearchaeota archaeon]|nr:hypothetical protein [Candidatus Woesearchaeota archaeon]
GDVDEIHQLEELILVKHKETADLIKSSKATLQTILKGTQWGKIKELKQADFTAGAVTIQTSGATLTKSQLTWLINKFKTLMLKSAFEKQTEAKKDLQGLMAKTREFYK